MELRSHRTPDERIYWRRNKDERDVGVVFLLDMSASTAEAVEEGARDADWNVPADPVAYTAWLRARRGETARRPYKRIPLPSFPSRARPGWTRSTSSWPLSGRASSCS